MNFYIVPDLNTSFTNFLGGQYQQYHDITAENVSRVKSETGGKAEVIPTGSYTRQVIFFNTKKKPWDDIRVRQVGRDELSRVLRGATISLEVGVFTVGLGVTFGILVGLVSGYFGGKTDFLLQRIVETFQALPYIIFALAIVTALGRSLSNVVVALAIASWPGVSRVIRSSVLSIKQMSYVDAARATGCGPVRILWRHILPNVVPVAIILATAGLGAAILAEASLSFLGVGIRPPTPSWGSMINDSSGVIQRYPYLVIFPGIAISLVVFAFNFLGDALRDYLDPRLRGAR